MAENRGLAKCLVMTNTTCINASRARAQWLSASSSSNGRPQKDALSELPKVPSRPRKAPGATPHIESVLVTASQKQSIGKVPNIMQTHFSLGDRGSTHHWTAGNLCLHRRNHLIAYVSCRPADVADSGQTRPTKGSQRGLTEDVASSAREADPSPRAQSEPSEWITETGASAITAYPSRGPPKRL